MTKLLLYEKTKLSLSSISRFYAVIHTFGYIHTYLYPIVLSHAKRYTLLVSNRKCCVRISVDTTIGSIISIMNCLLLHKQEIGH